MKINAKIYNSVTTEPFDVQQLDDGVVIELHSLNQNEQLFNEYAPKAKFAIWSSLDGQTYRLLLEDTYYPRMREFYGRRVNQCMINFWDAVEKDRSKIMKFLFVPASIVLFLGLLLTIIFVNQIGEDTQMIIMGILMVAFIIVNFFVNKKVDGIVNKHNSEAINKIKHIIGHKRFEELMDEQQAHYDEFFGINNDEEVVETAEELPTENSNNEE